MKRLILLASLALMAAGPDDRYARCIAMAQTQPKAAFTLASLWRAEGNAVAAMHCQAQALLAQGENARAAGVLDAAAEALTQNPAKDLAGAADLNAQAAAAWALAGDPARAIARYTTALAQLPSTGPKAIAARAAVLADRAQVFAQQDDKVRAYDDLTAAIAAAPQAELYLLRAEVALSRADLAAASADIAAARALPMDAELQALAVRLEAKAKP